MGPWVTCAGMTSTDLPTLAETRPAALAARAEAQRLSGQVVVDGVLTTPLTDDVFPVQNPADLSIVGHCPRCGEADVARAVDAARRAFSGWSSIPARTRGALVVKAGDAIEREAEGIARLVALETGNAYKTQSRPEASGAADILRYFGGLASELKGTTSPWESGTLTYTIREPLGVVGAIIPWNAPLGLTACKVGPALVTGNTIVLKSAEQAPLAVLRIAEIMQEVFPPGVVNVITGYGEECGKPLALHPDVRKVTFTGSSAVGREVATYCAHKLCPVTLELGGKSPNVVMADADLDLAVPGVMAGMRFARQGQSCSAGTRIFLHEAVYDEILERVLTEIDKLKIGDPLDDDTEVGTIISQEQFDRVVRFCEMAREDPNASILCGGERPADPALQTGYYFAPTLVENIGNDSAFCQEEIFGPVAAVLRWNDFDELMRDANATDFGLAATVWTRDLAGALKFAHGIDAGFVQVNQYSVAGPSISYGGFKGSGLGKENSLESMVEHFTRTKSVIVKTPPLA